MRKNHKNSKEKGIKEGVGDKEFSKTTPTSWNELAEIDRIAKMLIRRDFSDGLLFFDKKRKLVLINPLGKKFFNIANEDITGKSFLQLKASPILKPLMGLMGADKEEVFRKELLLSENLVVEASVIPILREKENLGTLVILHDITREKKIEKMKSEFVSLAAHQLRTPLSAIKWTLKMLLDGDLGEINLTQREFIEKTYNSNERMISLINDLLNVARIEEGRYLYQPVLADIVSLVNFVVTSYKDEAAKRKLKIEFKKPVKEPFQLMIDVEKMRLAIQSLIDNAVKYTQPGGEVTVLIKHDKNEVEVSVSDTGAGIPKDQQERVFSKFFRGPNVVRMATEGSGLGLFIAKNVIEAHGGRIWFESEENKGSTFYFTLPTN